MLPPEDDAGFRSRSSVGVWVGRRPSWVCVRLSKALARGVRSDHLKPRTKVLNREVLLSSVDPASGAANPLQQCGLARVPRPPQLAGWTTLRLRESLPNISECEGPASSVERSAGASARFYARVTQRELSHDTWRLQVGPS